jgi:hypothetical protein
MFPLYIKKVFKLSRPSDAVRGNLHTYCQTNRKYQYDNKKSGFIICSNTGIMESDFFANFFYRCKGTFVKKNDQEYVTLRSSSGILFLSLIPLSIFVLVFVTSLARDFDFLNLLIVLLSCLITFSFVSIINYISSIFSIRKIIQYLKLNNFI